MITQTLLFKYITTTTIKVYYVYISRNLNVNIPKSRKRAPT